MNREQIHRRLRPIFQQVLDREVNLTDDMTQGNVEGWDSVAHLTLVLTVETEFGVKFTVSEVAETKSVGDLTSFIAKKSIGDAT